LIQSGSAKDGMAFVEVNGQQLDEEETTTVSFADGREGTVTWNSTHEVKLQAGLFEVEVENSD